MENKKWIFLTLIGAVLMIIGSAVGSTAFYAFLYNVFSDYISDDLKPLISGILAIISFLAAGGGYTVIAGVVLVVLKWYRLGRIIISFGTGFGLLAIIVYIAYYVVNLTGIITDPTMLAYLTEIYGLFSFNTGFGFGGTVLAVIGRMGLKKQKEITKETPAPQEEEASEVFDAQVKYCPNCGKAVPLKANFCNECGTDFDER
ncbi:MAG: zinc ribbon domain-containing protein [Promethearchaeota archaeon]|nr:MAG: zinc ribbon domain-containing protein [Candidatus Lokiarchaeota archaeon]